MKQQQQEQAYLSSSNSIRMKRLTKHMAIHANVSCLFLTVFPIQTFIFMLLVYEDYGSV